MTTLCSKFCDICISLGVSVVADAVVPKRPLSLIQLLDVFRKAPEQATCRFDLSQPITSALDILSCAVSQKSGLGLVAKRFTKGLGVLNEKGSFLQLIALCWPCKGAASRWELSQRAT